MRASFPALICAAALAASVVTASPAQAANTPDPFSSVTAQTGPDPGEVTVSWQHSGDDTTHYQLETATSMFSPSSTSSLPTVGRNRRLFTVDGSERSLTLTSSQVADAVRGGTGIHLFYRLYALNRSEGAEAIRRYPYLQAVLPEPRVSAAAGTMGAQIGTLRAGTFNVRTAKATTDERTWLERRASVARVIVAHNPDVLALQELGAGRADGKSGSTTSSTGGTRQTLSLLNSLASINASHYKLVRTTHYYRPGTEHGTQGMRILYNSRTVTPLLTCPDKTGSSSWSASCTFKLPILSGDSEDERVVAAYQKFKIRATGAQFYMVSVHLNGRHSSSTSTETTYSKLRAQQVQAAVSGIAKLNTGKLPVIIAGDTNSWQNLSSGDLAREKFGALGYTDSASARSRTNLKYSTYNGFARTQEASGVGIASRLDGVFTRGAMPTTYHNVTKPTDTARPSDHNLVVSNLRILRL